jgi:azurin
MVILSTMAISAFSFAESCSIDVDSTDSMRFDTNSIEVSKTCKEFTVNLTHSGKLPKTAMGHNWVLTNTADARAVAAEGISAGIDNEYVKPGDPRVIAMTDLIGGGEKTSVTFSTSKLSADGKYTFFCSFPGHIGLMIGTLSLK